MSRGSRRARRLLLMQPRSAPSTDELGLELEDDDALGTLALDEELAEIEAADTIDVGDFLAPPEALALDVDESGAEASAAPRAETVPAAEVVPVAETVPSAPSVGMADAPPTVSATTKDEDEADDEPSVRIPFDLDGDAPEPSADAARDDEPPQFAEMPRLDRPAARPPANPAAPSPPPVAVPRTPAPTMKSVARRTSTPASAPPATKSKSAPVRSASRGTAATRASSSPSEAAGESSGLDALQARFEYLARRPHPPLLDELRRLVADYRPLTWVFTGDGVTQGGRFVRQQKNFAELFSERIRWELKRFQDVVVNTGMEGERVAGLAKRLDWRVLRFRPDVVALQIGLQDALAGPDGRDAFRSGLRETVDRIRESGAIVLLQTPNRFRHRDIPGWNDLPRYVEAIRETAEAAGVPLVDHWAHWERLSAARHAVPLLSEDGLHPGRRGHRELARLLFAVLDVLDPHSPTCADE